MVFNKGPINKKYFWIELGFLLFLSFGISLISDLEYSAYEEHDISKFAKNSGYRLITGYFSLICYGIYYWGFLKKYIFKRNIAAVSFCSIGFVMINHLIHKYPSNWIIIHTGLVSEEIKKRALASLNSNPLIFTFNYDLISSIVPLIGLAFVIRSLTQDAQMKELKEQQLISELNYLKAQIQPHFFFNTLNNIYSLALKQSKDTAPMVAKLGDMMRYILYEADKETVNLKREIGFLTDYVAVEQMRHPDNVINFDVQNIAGDAFIAPLLLLPFVENAFKHGLQDELSVGFVNIILVNSDDDLTLKVTNSKPENDTLNKKGIGLENIAKRLKLLYPDKYHLECIDANNTYTVNLTLLWNDQLHYS